MPFYKLPGLGMVHVKMSGRQKPPAPCIAVVGFSAAAAERDHCCACSEYLCDWPTAPGKTCDAPLCSAHAHLVGTNRHYCPDHHAAHTHQHPQRSLFGFITEADQ